MDATQAKNRERCGEKKRTEDEAHVAVAEQGGRQTDDEVRVGRRFIPQGFEAHRRTPARLSLAIPEHRESSGRSR